MNSCFKIDLVKSCKNLIIMSFTCHWNHLPGEKYGGVTLLMSFKTENNNVSIKGARSKRKNSHKWHFTGFFPIHVGPTVLHNRSPISENANSSTNAKFIWQKIIIFPFQSLHIIAKHSPYSDSFCFNLKTNCAGIIKIELRAAINYTPIMTQMALVELRRGLQKCVTIILSTERCEASAPNKYLKYSSPAKYEPRVCIASLVLRGRVAETIMKIPTGRHFCISWSSSYARQLRARCAFARALTKRTRLPRWSRARVDVA